MAPDYWAVRGWTSTVEKLHLNADVAFFGNSITWASNFETLFKEDSLLIIELGYPGDNIEGMIRRMDMLQSCNPHKIFIMAGINGLNHQTPDQFSTLYEQLIDSVQTRIPKAKLYLESILPVNNRMKEGIATNEQILIANKCIQKIAKAHNAQYVDLHRLYYKNGEMSERFTTDGLHLKQEAYKLWAKEIHKYVITN